MQTSSSFVAPCRCIRAHSAIQSCSFALIPGAQPFRFQRWLKFSLHAPLNTITPRRMHQVRHPHLLARSPHASTLRCQSRSDRATTATADWPLGAGSKFPHCAPAAMPNTCWFVASSPGICHRCTCAGSFGGAPHTPAFLPSDVAFDPLPHILRAAKEQRRGCTHV